ncbi:related to GCP3 (gamma-tubulin complex) [Rhynchosporium secalis]|uniref:Spindle pole body component n=1 Tax=Rhynchosporium secalis TaxID=38038 RepID=A0A1E1MVD4_RHYSE|nr:related to GCP3 (gamma-tubulin complex) [Rhynchosporium secalis]
MAHVAKLSALTDELVELITSTRASAKSDQTKFSIHRESALRALRFHGNPRTNQFEITTQLEGLEEKLRVYNEDPLADALRERLDKLSSLEVKWTPEILHLLLELSDQPVTRSNLENLDFLKEPVPDTGPTLKWKDLVAEDPSLRDESVWRNVDFTAGDSDGEDWFEDSRSEVSAQTDTTAHSSVEDEFGRRPEEHAVNTIDMVALKELQKQQFWRKIPNVSGVKLETVRKSITELQAIREVLFMLGGLQSSLFEVDAQQMMEIRPSKGYALNHASPEAFFKLVSSFAENGSSLARLRSWVRNPQIVPLLQVLQSTLHDRIHELDKYLSEIQQRFILPQEDSVVSLLSVQTELASQMLPLVRLSNIIKNLDTERYPHAFRYLEMIYDDTCTSQMNGDEETYEYMGRIFFDCFRMYLRPIRTWMEKGQLENDDKVFFVSETTGEVDLPSLWQSRFKIRKTQDGVLHAPKFLQAAANKIFNTGQSVVVLKHLNQYESLRSARGTEPILDFDTVCYPSVRLAPFSELLVTAFDGWVQSKHHHASSILRKTLFDSCGLQKSLDAFAHIYFMADGITASAFTNNVFDKLDTLNASWIDRFTLTELSQSTFGSIASVNPDRLRTHILTIPRKHRDVANCRKSVKALAVLEFKYHLPWPIQIILTPSTTTLYKRIFTFLLQIRRSSHILTRQRLISDRPTSNSSSDERAIYYVLRSGLLWFNQMLYHYLTSLVIEPLSRKMRTDLETAEDVDAMTDVHSTYIKTAIDQALLGSKLELIHKTILKILDLGIKLEDAQAANAAANKGALEHQQDMMDLSMASLGLQTPRKKAKQFLRKPRLAKKDLDSSSEEDDVEVDVDLSMLSSPQAADREELLYIGSLRNMKADFDRLVRFVASGLKGVARAGGGDDARSWEALGEILESGLDNGTSGYR